MEKQIAAALKQLSESVRKIKDLVAWLELEKAENKGRPESSFHIRSSTAEDLRHETGAYFSTLFDVYDALGACPDTTARKLRGKLEAIHNRFLKIHLARPFYS